jgi:hypothetical protein
MVIWKIFIKTRRKLIDIELGDHLPFPVSVETPGASEGSKMDCEWLTALLMERNKVSQPSPCLEFAYEVGQAYAGC